jgi:hypothetical protein
VDERGRLQRVIRPFLPQVTPRTPPQFKIDERQQVVTGLEVAATPRFQENAD